MWNSFNKRKFPRIEVACDVNVKEHNSPELISTKTENVGEGGVCLILDSAIAPFSRVDLKLDIGKLGEAPIECSGKIVWCIRSQVLHQKEVKYDTGVEFLDISPEDRDRVKKFIEEKVGV